MGTYLPDRRWQVAESPSWIQVREALLRLDGHLMSEVSLELVGTGSMMVGGGNGGRYLVVYFPADHPDTPSLTLTDPSLSGPDVELTVQTPAEYPARMAVQLPLVLTAIEHFYQTRRVLHGARWEINSTGAEAEL